MLNFETSIYEAPLRTKEQIDLIKLDILFCDEENNRSIIKNSISSIVKDSIDKGVNFNFLDATMAESLVRDINQMMLEWLNEPECPLVSYYLKTVNVVDIDNKIRLSIFYKSIWNYFEWTVCNIEIK